MKITNHARITLFILFSIGIMLWFTPAPEPLTHQAWHCLHIFILMITGIILCPIPVSLIALLGSLTAIITHTLTFNEIFSEFSSKIIWIIVFAFFIARAFIKTGLGHRLAYYFIKKLGHNIVGLSYGLLLTECMLAPMIPSVAARSGGVVFPITQSIIASYGEGENATPLQIKTTGAYLMNVCCHGSILCSALFLTSMAGNPLAAEFASRMGIQISWTTWFIGAFAPGFSCLALLPWLLRLLSPPGIVRSTRGPQLAAQELVKMGPLSVPEIKMIIALSILIIGWVGESFIGIDSTSVAILGVIGLILSEVITWNDVISEKNAWDTLLWFAILLAFSTQLSRLGIMSWITSSIAHLVSGIANPILLGFLLCTLYFYIHYFFASLTSHITVFYALFLHLMVQASLPPLGSALILGYLSNLFGGLTHYGSSASPIFYGSGYQTIAQWWRVGFIISTFNFILWLTISSLWLPLLGFL